MLVSEYMTKNPIVLSPEDDVQSAFNLLLENIGVPHHHQSPFHKARSIRAGVRQTLNTS